MLSHSHWIASTQTFTAVMHISSFTSQELRSSPRALRPSQVTRVGEVLSSASTMQERGPSASPTPNSSTTGEDAIHQRPPLHWTVSVSKSSASSNRSDGGPQLTIEQLPHKTTTEIFGGQLDGLQDEETAVKPQTRVASTSALSSCAPAPLEWVFCRSQS